MTESVRLNDLLVAIEEPERTECPAGTRGPKKKRRARGPSFIIGEY